MKNAYSYKYLILFICRKIYSRSDKIINVYDIHAHVGKTNFIEKSVEIKIMIEPMAQLEKINGRLKIIFSLSLN